METALKLPNNYVELEQEEMMYLDGGLRMSHNQIQAMVWAIGATGGQAARVGERLFTAMARRCGLHWGVGWTFVVIPHLRADLI